MCKCTICKFLSVLTGRNSIRRALPQSDDYCGSFACDDPRCSWFRQILSVGKRCPSSNVATVSISIVYFITKRNLILNKYIIIQFRLMSQVKISMCLMLQSTVWTEREENHVDYFRVTHEVLQSFFHRYYYCSTK